MPVRAVTMEKAREVARLLEADEALTTDAACIEAGVSPNAVRLALKRFRDGTSSETEEPIIGVVALAIERQCKTLVTRGEAAAGKDQKTGWWQWLLEKKHPQAFGREQVVRHKGDVDEPVAVVSLTEKYIAMSAEERRREYQRITREESGDGE